MITTTPKIGLRIGGTKQRRGGFQPLVAIGVLAGNEANNMDRVTLVSEKPSYVLKHTPDYILYMLVDRRVKSFDADAPGVLTIALTIANDMKLAEQKSPFSLLSEIYNTFVGNYMTRLSDGTDRFIDKDADTELFKQVVERYPLEPRVKPPVPMTPSASTGIVCIPSDQLEAFFRDTDYREFSGFSDLEIGTACTCSPGLDNLEIPRLTAYEIWVNGQKYNCALRQRAGEDSASISLPSYYPVSFTLDALLQSPDHRIESAEATVVLDPVKNRINCTIRKQDESARLVFKWQCDESSKMDVISMLKSSRVRIWLGSKDVSVYAVSDRQYEVYMDAVNKLFVRISPDTTPRYEMKVSKELLEHEGQKLLQVTIGVNRKEAKPIPLGPTGGARHDDSKGATEIPSGGHTENKDENGKGPSAKRMPIDLKTAIIAFLAGVLLGAGAMLLKDYILQDEKKSELNDNASTFVDQPTPANNDTTQNDSKNVEEVETTVNDPYVDSEKNAGTDGSAEVDRAKAKAAKAAKAAETAKEEQKKAEEPKLSRKDAIIAILNGNKKKIDAARKTLGKDAQKVEQIREWSQKKDISITQKGKINKTIGKLKDEKMTIGDAYKECDNQIKQIIK